MSEARRSSWALPARAVAPLKVVVFLLLLAPAARLVWRAWVSYRGTGDGLGVNPIETLTHRTGDYTLYCLLATLAITPLGREARSRHWQQLERMRDLGRPPA